MRWKAKNYNVWHEYFPILPVKVKNEWVWLERIYRRGEYLRSTSNGRKRWRWEYVNSEFDILKSFDQRIEKAGAELLQTSAQAAMSQAKAYVQSSNAPREGG